MSVEVLLIEGVTSAGSKPGRALDGRLLNKLLGGVCTVRPRGSKYYMALYVEAAREAGQAGTYALLDGDFRYPVSGLRSGPVPWHDGRESLLGWRWARKEVENYLLDPEVVSRALRFDEPMRVTYAAALERACVEIADYQAARMTLSSVRPRPPTLENRWGRKRGAGRYPFPDPGERTEPVCRARLAAAIGSLGELRLPPAAQEAYERECEAKGVDSRSRRTAGDLIELATGRFESLRIECRSGGEILRDALVWFAGKDVLWAMESDLEDAGHGSPAQFLERIMVGIEDSAEDVWTWLPEWAELRRLAQSV